MNVAEFHLGEQEVQRRAGVVSRPKKEGPQFKREIPPAAAHFLQTLDVVYLSARDAQGKVWCSPLLRHSGFIEILNERELTWPDFAGNKMFCTLGNIAVNPAAGLLFWNAAGDRFLQLSGRVGIDWDSPRVAKTPEAQRFVIFEIEEVIETHLV